MTQRQRGARVRESRHRPLQAKKSLVYVWHCCCLFYLINYRKWNGNRRKNLGFGWYVLSDYRSHLCELMVLIRGKGILEHLFSLCWFKDSDQLKSFEQPIRMLRNEIRGSGLKSLYMIINIFLNMVSIDKACFLMFNTRLVILQPHPIPRIEQVGHILLLYYSILLLLMLLYSAIILRYCPCHLGYYITCEPNKARLIPVVRLRD